MLISRLSLAIIASCLISATADAQAAPAIAAASNLEGNWTGEIVTDAFRGTIGLAISRGAAGWDLALTAKVGDRDRQGSGTIEMISRDSIRFVSTVGGALTTYWGGLHGDSLKGTLEARHQGELVGRGEWRVVRPRAAAAAPRSTSPVAIFDEAWTLVDKRYGNFTVKGIDWNMMRSIYRDRAASAQSDRELANILSTMLGHLNDNHVSLRVNDSLYHPNGAPDRSSFVDDTIVTRRFVGSSRKAGGGDWTYAWLKDSIGYLRIDGFQNTPRTRAEIDSILEDFRTARGLVIDLRKHYGGDDIAAREVINRFALTREAYLSSRTRSGDRHDEFLAPRTLFREPRGPWQFKRPVMVLTSRRTVSAGENFLLGFRDLPQVTVIGDVTSGAFADVGHFTLANGWQLNFPYNQFRDRNGQSWEGVGLAPDVRQVTRPSDIEAGLDVVLDLAVRAVNAVSMRK